jgi:hypothetical protein
MDFLGIAVRKHRIRKIRRLVDEKIVRELPPVAGPLGSTSYWHYEVLKPDLLPDEFKEQYNQLGEIRW